jgi:putative ABC transport system permease protein
MTSLRFALSRLRARPLLSSLLLVGLALAVALLASLPVYAEAATARVLADQSFEELGYRSPFAYLFWYSAELEEPLDWSDAASVDEYLRIEGLTDLGLPAYHTTSFVETYRFLLRSPDADGENLGRASLAALDDLTDRARLVAGRQPSSDMPDGIIEIAVPQALAEELDLEPGDRVDAFDTTAATEDPMQVLTLEVVGIWEPIDPTDTRWIIEPIHLESRVFTTREIITDVLSPQKPDLIRTAAWYTLLDASSLSTDDVGRLINAAGSVGARASSLLPGLSLAVDPVDSLLEFQSRANSLSRWLIVYAIPSLGLVLIFIMLVVSLTTDDRRGEMAVLRSRGASRFQLLGQTAVEALIIAVGAAIIGVFGSLGVAALMGRTRTFLDLSNPNPLSLALPSRSWLIAAIVVVVAVALQVISVIGASGATVITHDELTARAVRRPWWQRSSLDLIIVAAVIAVSYQLLKGEPTADPTSLTDPVTILLPAMASLAVGLLMLRLLPLLLELGAKLLAHTPSTVALVAARRAARSPGNSHIPLLLLVVTVGLAIFTASLARTLDLQLFDEAYHQAGADWNVYEASSRAMIQGVELSSSSERALASMEDYEAIPGIEQATRVSELSARMRTEGRSTTWVTFYGIDADSFADVAFFRSDYGADVPVPDAVARLEATPEAVLVHESLGLSVGQVIEVDLFLEAQILRTRLVVAGFLDQFPTWYPDADPPVVGNLDYVFVQTGQPGGYHVWLTLEEGASADAELDTDITLAQAESPLHEISATMRLPERQGVFGLLTVGFIGSILVSMMGFFFATLFRVRRSTVELGVLQALGLTPRQVGGILVLELGLLVGTGLAAGIFTGMGLSRWLIVRLVNGSGLDATPPLLAELDQGAIWTVTGLLAGLFVIGAVALVVVLRHMRVFEALKLGEAP